MIGAIIGGAPTWVYVLLAVLLALGMRRLKSREVPITVALIPVVVFLAWSIFGAVAFAARAGALLGAATWLGGGLIGAASAYLLPDPPVTRVSPRRINLPGSVIPLVLYLTVFVVRFACGAWAAIVPEQATLASASGLAVSAAVTLRLTIGALSWPRAV